MSPVRNATQVEVAALLTGQGHRILSGALNFLKYMQII